MRDWTWKQELLVWVAGIAVAGVLILLSRHGAVTSEQVHAGFRVFLKYGLPALIIVAITDLVVDVYIKGGEERIARAVIIGSALVPGLGQMFCGRYKRAALMFFLFAGLVLAVLLAGGLAPRVRVPVVFVIVGGVAGLGAVAVYWWNVRDARALSGARVKGVGRS